MTSPSSDSSSRPPNLLDQLREHICVKHYSIRTEQAYVQRVKQYLLFDAMRHRYVKDRPRLVRRKDDRWVCFAQPIAGSTSRSKIALPRYLVNAKNSSGSFSGRRWMLSMTV